MSGIDQKLHDLENDLHALRLDLQTLKEEFDLKNKATSKAHSRIDLIEKRTTGIEHSIEELKRESISTNVKIDFMQKTVEESYEKHEGLISLQSKHTKQLVTTMKDHETHLKKQNDDLMKKLFWLITVVIAIAFALSGLDISLLRG